MTQIQFYHLTASPLEKALPKLLEKAYGAKFRVLVKLASPELVEVMDKVFWTYHPTAFLPHGTVGGVQPEAQPVLLCAGLDNKNNANLLCVTDGTQVESPGDYERVLDIFDGGSPDSLAAARARWKTYQVAGHDVTYYSQTEKGGWEKAA